MGSNGSGATGRRVRALAAVAWLGLVTGLLLLLDRVAMRTWLDPERLFLADVLHRPRPDGVEFNEHGLRETRPPSGFPESDFNVIVLGDSFVYGYGLEAHQALPQRLQFVLRRRRPERRINVANFGYVSASPYLSLRQLEDFGRLYHPDLVLLCIDMSDFHDDIKHELYERKPGLFRLLHVLPSGFFALKSAARSLGLHEAVFGYPADRFFPVNRPLDESRRHLAWLERNVDAIARFSREVLGARFAVLVFPRTFQYSDREVPDNWEGEAYTALGPWVHEPFRYFAELARRRDYPVGSLLPAFQEADVFPTAFGDDPHWTPRGVTVALGGVLRFLDREALLAPPEGPTRPGS